MMDIKILPQPDDVTCGPTSLHAVYSYFGDEVALEQVIKEINQLNDGGTLAVVLGNHALKRGYDATIYTYNLKLFDPTWKFRSNEVLTAKLREQLKHKKGEKLQWATRNYIQFLESGGKVRFRDISSTMIRRFLAKGYPILVGLSATYLYGCSREYTDDAGNSISDDVKGTPMGHFVVLCGMDEKKQVIVADPFKGNPTDEHYYPVSVHRLIHSILLGIVTYDANLLIINPKRK